MIGRFVHRARRARGRLTARLLGGSVVLLYHRVADPGGEGSGDPFSLCVSPARFGEHLQVLRGVVGGPSLPLENLLPPGAARGVAITFDDGYADNLHAALPLLERHECPATLFAVTDAPGQEFWWDTMARLGPEAVRKLLGELEGEPPEGPGGEVDGAAAQGTGATARARNAARPQARLHARLLEVEPSERRDTLEARAEPERGNARAMDAGELDRMAQSPLVTVGGHTHTHADLGALDPEAQLREIRTNRLEIERITGTRPRTFAYPFGRFSNFSRVTVDLLRGEGFQMACTAEPGVVRRRTHPLHVPRLWVGDWPGDEFEQRLRRWVRLA